jgi:hypothetical protein
MEEKTSLLLFWSKKVYTCGLLLGETEMYISCGEKSRGGGAVEKIMLSLHTISITQVGELL